MERADWERVDKVRFFGVGGCLFCGCTAALYPLFAIKTQAQVEGVGLAQAARGILARAGPGGFLRGLPTVLIAELPIQTAYVAVLESSRKLGQGVCDKAGLTGGRHEGLSGALSGACACLATQAFVVPADVVSQRQVVSAGRGLGAVATAQRVVRVHGLAGLYRGLALSCLQYVPASSLWWATYGAVRHQASDALQRWSEPLAGVVAGLTTATATQPIDTVRTRLQTEERRRRGRLLAEAWGAAYRLWATEGARALFRGLGSRALHQACWGTAMVSLYEHLRRFAEVPAAGAA